MNNKASIAVLPFVNKSSVAETEYFCDGITEEIINALAQIQHLQVISRTSCFLFKHSKKSIQDIGNELQVSSIVEGSVRVGGNQLRISARLIDVESDTAIWSNTWDRPVNKVFEIQDEISLHIAEKLREHFGHLYITDHLFQEPTHNLTAYQHMLKGRHLFYTWNPQNVNLAVEEFERAIQLDNNLIDAHLGLADSLSFLAVSGFAPREQSWKKANASINRVKKINPLNAKLNYMLGNQAFFTQGNFQKSLEFGLQSVESKPNYAEALCFLSFLYDLKGEFKKAGEYIDFAKSIDPLSQETMFFEANHLYRIRQFEESKKIIDHLLEINPKNLPARAVHCYLLIKTKKYSQALDMLNQLPQGMITPDEKLGLIALTQVMMGQSIDKELAYLEDQLNNPKAHHAHSYLFLIYANLGKNDQAFKILNLLFEHHSSVLLLGFSDPLGEAIHRDKRYLELHKKVYSISKNPIRQKSSLNHRKYEQQAESHANLLTDYIEKERPYLNPTLSLQMLAGQLKIHPNNLSWLLNDRFNKNFNEFINGYRLNHFKNLLLNPKNKHISILGLAFESGFNSKSVFNTYFKKVEGKTPKEFLLLQSK